MRLPIQPSLLPHPRSHPPFPSGRPCTVTTASCVLDPDPVLERQTWVAPVPEQAEQGQTCPQPLLPGTGPSVAVMLGARSACHVLEDPGGLEGKAACELKFPRKEVAGKGRSEAHRHHSFSTVNDAAQGGLGWRLKPGPSPPLGLEPSTFLSTEQYFPFFLFLLPF